MKIQDLIEKNFTVIDSSLRFEDADLGELATKHQRPLFAYSPRIIRRNIKKLRENLPSFRIYYSVKANPNPSVLSTVLEEVDGLEIASIGEMEQAQRADCPPRKILFAGPGKTDSELESAIREDISEIHIESLGELKRLARIANRQQKIQNISIRVNLSAQAQGGAMQMGGKPTAFGIDEEKVDEAIEESLATTGVILHGLHFYTGTQILNAETLANTYKHAAELAIRLVQTHKFKLASIDFGGGLGVPYFESETELDIATAGSLIEPIAQKLKSTPDLKHCELIIEPGRYIVAEAGVYVTKVVDIKESRGVSFTILNGGMNHHLAASGNLGQVIKRNFPIVCANRIDTDVSFETEVSGPLCTPLDTLGRKALLPPLEVGDTICILQSGAYGKTASPSGFLSHPEALEIFLSDGIATGC